MSLSPMGECADFHPASPRRIQIWSTIRLALVNYDFPRLQIICRWLPYVTSKRYVAFLDRYSGWLDAILNSLDTSNHSMRIFGSEQELANIVLSAIGKVEHRRAALAELGSDVAARVGRTLS